MGEAYMTREEKLALERLQCEPRGFINIFIDDQNIQVAGPSDGGRTDWFLGVDSGFGFVLEFGSWEEVRVKVIEIINKLDPSMERAFLQARHENNKPPTSLAL
jgi:hypothetical protein